MKTQADNALAAAGSTKSDIVPVTGHIGAEIRGIHLSGNMDAATIEALREALNQYKVIFIRGQNHLDDAGHEAFSEQLGPLLKHPSADVAEGSQAIMELQTSEAYSASVWHTDLTFIPQVAAYGILRPCVLPEYGGDTLWANAAHAYQRLPAPLKILADHLWGLHSTDFDFDGNFSDEYKLRMRDYGAKMDQKPLVTRQPVVHVHPLTGERSLLLGVWLKRLDGLTNAQSQKIFELFQEYIEAPENTVRWHWQPGDVAIWDNLATQHRSVPDFGDQQRVMRRVTVAGQTVPTSVDGQQACFVSH